MAQHYPKGLLSFLYHVIYDRDVNEAFHTNEVGQMKWFGLSPESQLVFAEGGKLAGQTSEEAQQKREDLLNQLMQQLASELLEGTHKIIW
jgi:hypothetical protein